MGILNGMMHGYEPKPSAATSRKRDVSAIDPLPSYAGLAFPNGRRAFWRDEMFQFDTTAIRRAELQGIFAFIDVGSAQNLSGRMIRL